MMVDYQDSSLICCTQHHFVQVSCCNQNALEAQKHELFGSIVALALQNGHSGPNFFSQAVMNFILGLCPLNDWKILLKELPMDYKEIKEKLEKIARTETEEVFTALVLDLPERFDFGFSKAPLSLNGKLPLIQAACKHYLVSACMK